MPKVTRRGFLVGCSAAIAAMAGGRLNTAVFGSPEAEPNQEILVIIFLRGGCDALNVIFPLAGDDRGHYEAARPDLQVPVGTALALNAQFGLHPAAAPLFDLYQDDKLALILATGMDEDTRSHFDAMAYMELGTPGTKATTSGWLARHLASAENLPGDIVVPALSAGVLQPTSLLSQREALTLSRVNTFSLNTGPWHWRDPQRAALRNLYEQGDAPVYQSGVEALNAVDIVEANAADYVPENGAVYPDTSFGDQMQLLAQMIKAQLGLQVATIDLGGWDTHENQGDGDGGYFASLLGQLAAGMSAFYTDLDGGHTQRLTVVTLSEFGRRLRSNADGGCDHGHAGAMMVLGGEALGGLHGIWPGLANELLYDGADLAVTTDYRRILSEILIRRMGNPHLGTVFPGYQNYSPMNIVQGTDLEPIYDGPPLGGENRVHLPYVTAS